MTFQRVNDGVAFAADEILQPADANALRENGELGWVSSAMRFRRDEYAVTDGGDLEFSSFGPLTWLATRGCYTALNFPYGTTPRQLMMSVGAAGSAAMSELNLTPPAWMSSGLRYLYEVTGAGAGMIQVGTNTSSVTFTGSSGFGAWSDIATVASFSLTNAPMCQVGNKAIFAGSDAAHGSILVASFDLSGGSSKKATSSGLSGYLDSLATDGITAAAVGLPTDGRYVTIAGASTGSDFTIAAPGAADYQKRIAWDARLSQWVILAYGSSGGGNPGDLFFAQRASITGFGSGTWKRAPLGMTRFIVDDFTITAQGIWCVIGRESFTGGGYYRHDVMLCSIDGGATWTKHSLGLVGYASSSGPLAPWRFASAGGPLIVAMQKPAADGVTIASGGLFDLGTTITTVTV
jgi:hypothetical protein